MISPDLRFDPPDAEEWLRLRRMLRPGPSSGGGAYGASARPRPLVLVIDGGRTVQALRPSVFGEPPELEDPARFPWSGAASLARHRQSAGAKIAAAVDVAAGPRLAERIDATLRVGDDLVAQGLCMLRAARGELGRTLFVDPDPFSALPVPGYAALQQTFDLMLPDDRAAALFVWERGLLAASAVVEKRGGHVVRVTSARALGVGPNADFRDGRHRHVLETMTRAGLRPHAAVFCTREALRDILGPQPGALAQAVALRQAVIDPLPPWLLAFVGAGAAAGVAQTANRLFGSFVPQSFKDRARDAAKNLQGFSPWASLGFDPIQIFTDLAKLFA